MGWQNASGDNKRPRVETAIGRYKRLIGDGLHFHKETSRDTEVAIAVCRPSNRMTAFARPESVRIP